MKGSSLCFDQSEDIIIRDTLAYIDNLISSVNDFARPEFCKLQFLTQEEFILQEENEE